MEWEGEEGYKSSLGPTPETVLHSNILIVGAGVFGTSAAYHLSKTQPNATVTIIDRTPYPPRHAASTDINKIVRADYSSPFYMDLAYEAMQAWNSWPELKPFYHRTGWVNFSQQGSDLAARIRKNFQDRGADPTSDLDLDEIRSMFGGVFRDTDLDSFQSAYWNPEAGWCDAGAAVTAMLEVALQNPKVQYVVAEAEKLVLHQDEKSLQGVSSRSGEFFAADQVLLATGAWTSSLMTALEDELNIEEKDTVEKQVKATGVCVAHFRISDQEMKEMKEMPVVIYGQFGDGQPPPRRSQLLKFTNGATFTNTITTASGRKISVPPDRDQSTVPESLKQETLDVIASKVMPKYTSHAVDSWRLCWDAVSPSQDHLITSHPRLGNLFFAIGGSLHSWKFLPTIGRYICNVLSKDDASNGSDKDSRWAWKTGQLNGRGAHESAYPTRELGDIHSLAVENPKL